MLSDMSACSGAAGSPAVRIQVCEDPQHEFPERLRPEGGGDDHVAALWECAPHEHGARVDVGGRRQALLRQDVVHPILPVEFHLEKEKLLI